MSCNTTIITFYHMNGIHESECVELYYWRQNGCDFIDIVWMTKQYYLRSLTYICSRLCVVVRTLSLRKRSRWLLLFIIIYPSPLLKRQVQLGKIHWLETIKHEYCGIMLYRNRFFKCCTTGLVDPRPRLTCLAYDHSTFFMVS